MVSSNKVITVLNTVHNVRVTVPVVGARWRVGTFNLITSEVKQLGEGKDAVKKGCAYTVSGPEEKVFFTNGLLLKGSQGQNVIVNRTFWNLSMRDFGSTLNFNMEIKKEEVTKEEEETRTFTSLAFEKNNGYPRKNIQYLPLNKDRHNLISREVSAIFNTDLEIVIHSLPEPKVSAATPPTKQEQVEAA